MAPPVGNWRHLPVLDKSVAEHAYQSFCSSSAHLTEDVPNPIPRKLPAVLLTLPAATCWCSSQIPFCAWFTNLFLHVGPLPPTLLVDLRLRSSRTCLPILLDSLVSEDCICSPSLLFLMFWTMLACFRTFHIDGVHVPVPRIETMVARSFFVS